MSLLGYDDFLLSDLLDPVEMGRIAAETLFARVDGYETPSRQVVTPTQLMVRGSGEIRPATT